MDEKQPRRSAARDAIVAIVKAWMDRRKVTTQELAEVAEESVGTMHDRLIGLKPMPMEIIALLPRTDRQRITDLLLDLELPPVAA